MRRTKPVVVVLVGLLTVLPALPAVGQAASPDSPVVIESAPAERGTTELRVGPRGVMLTWVSPEPLPFVDAAPEFRLDGRLLGRATVSADRRTLRLLVDDDREIDLVAVGVHLGARRLDLAGSPVVVDTSGPPEADEVAEELGVDPAAEGTFVPRTVDYEATPLPWPEFTRPMEVLGHAVLPTGVTDAPLVLFLHGRHQPCYDSGTPSEGDTACPGPDTPVPSERGYDYLQRMLASQGIATVSIASNVINGDDYRSFDGGAAARGALVRQHLRLLDEWDTTPSSTDWFGTLDQSRVVLVGHSRGGEGVNAAVIDTTAADPFAIVGQVLIAPVDFSWQTAGYTPTSVFLPSCDGDVFDLQGQRFIEATPTAAPDDPSLRSSVLVIGANHNYFNTEWTPGIAAAPSFDDWFGAPDAPCGRNDVRRLSAPEQRGVAQTYVAASVDAFLNGTQSSVNVLDRGDVVIPPGVPDARVRTHALGGNRVTVRPGGGTTLTGRATACASVYGADAVVDAMTLPPCGLGQYPREMHWSPADEFFGSPEATLVGRLGATRQHEFAWSTPGRVAGIAPAAPLDARGPKATIDLRVVADPNEPAPELAVRVGDGTTSWTSPPFILQQYPGQALWAQPIRVDLTDATVDRGAITSVALVSRSERGRVVVLDTSVRRFGLQPVPDRDLPNLHLGEVTSVEGDGPGDGVGLVPFTLTGDVSQPSSFGVSIDRYSFDAFSLPAIQRVDVPAGVTSGVVEVPHEADGLDEMPVKRQDVVAAPLGGLATIDNRGYAEVADDDADVTVRVTPLRSPVDAGGRIGFRVRLSAHRDDLFVGRIRAVLAPGVAQIRTIDVPLSWRNFRISQPNVARPLSTAIANSTQRLVFIDAGARTVDVAIPTIDRSLAVTRSMSIRVDDSNPATVRLR